MWAQSWHKLDGINRRKEEVEEVPVMILLRGMQLGRMRRWSQPLSAKRVCLCFAEELIKINLGETMGYHRAGCCCLLFIQYVV